MTGSIVIADYGVGNLLSMERAISAIGCQPVRSRDPEIIAAASHLVLPGVGAFGHCIATIEKYGIHEAVREQVASGNPFLGVCVGMQVMLSRGQEYGDYTGFGFIPGEVRKIESENGTADVKVPLIGWNRLAGSEDGRWEGTILAGVSLESYFYFVHSYAAHPENSTDVLASLDYENIRVTAAVQRENMTGVQFHPEKSGPAGIALLEAFAGQ